LFEVKMFLGIEGDDLVSIELRQRLHIFLGHQGSSSYGSW